jgi:hypothetical protein
MTERDEGGMSRRDLMRRCVGWAGAGALYRVAGGIATSATLEAALASSGGSNAMAGTRGFTFLQISDTHIGFDKPANPDVRGSCRAAVAKIKAMPEKPDFVIHTGDITHLSTEAQFAEADAILSEIGLPIFHVPGEHDMLDEGGGQAYLARYGRGTKGAGWYSFDHEGVHFAALVNVANLKPGGMGHLGDDQIAWLKDDLSGLASSTPVVVFAHMPLWTVFPEWGWGTDDSEAALALLARFGSVTVLNGHVHQILQKVEGNLSFHTARSTAYPQPAPGAAPAPGPLKVPAEQLPSALGIRTARMMIGTGPVPLIESTLA